MLNKLDLPSFDYVGHLIVTNVPFDNKNFIVAMQLYVLVFV